MKHGNKYAEPPVNVGDEVEVEVYAKGSKGDGIARIGGFVVIVEQPIDIGHTYRVHITNVLKRLAFAKRLS